MFGLLVTGQAYAVEVFNAKTVIPTTFAPKAPKDIPIKANPSYYSPDDEIALPKYARREFRIPNPVDEFILKKIRAARANSLARKEEQKKKDKLLIDSNSLIYKDELSELEALGDVVMTSADGTIINADRAVYDKNANTVKLYDNIILTQDISRVESDYMFADLNEETIVMNEPVATVASNVRILAAEGYAYPDRIEGVNGLIELANKTHLRLQTSGFNYYREMALDEDEYETDTEAVHTSDFKLKAKEIEVVPSGEFNTITLKDSELYYKKLKLLDVGSIELFSDKDKTIADANLPIEFGSLSDFGTYVAMGYTFKLPTAKTLSISPALVHKGKLGLGVLGRLRSKRLDVHGGWATSSENLVLQGKYRFGDGFLAEFGRHSYDDEWFIGSRRAGYYAQLSHLGSYKLEDIDATYSNRFSAGYATRYRKKHQEDDNFGTTRFRWQGELSKILFKLTNKEQDASIEFGGTTQAMATVYGTGDTVGIFRIGPYIKTRLKNWRSRIFYAISGIHGRTPLEFDEYTYGKSTFEFDESIKLCKYLSIGYRGNLSPLKDNSEKELMTENRFYVVAGPDDVKLAFSYDTQRNNMYLDFMFLIGSDTAKLQYDKAIIKDPTKINVKEPFFGRDMKFRKIKVPDNL